MPATLAVMLSGSGRTLMNLADEIDAGRLDARIGLVVASRPCPGEQRARERGLRTIIERGRLSPERFTQIMDEHAIDLVVLAGYLQLVPVPQAYAGRIVNIHPALLPEFGGPGMHGEHVHRAVLASGARQSGCTVHLCDEAYDRGRILLQMRCDVVPGEGVESLAARVFELEKRAYPSALAALIADLPSRGGRDGDGPAGRD